MGKISRICDRCGAEIGPYETPYLHDWKVVCAACDLKLKRERGLLASLRAMLGSEVVQACVLLVGIVLAVIAVIGAYRWGYHDGRTEGYLAASTKSKNSVVPSTTRPLNQLGLPDDPEAVLALMRFGSLRKGMSVSAWKSSAEANRIRTSRRSGAPTDLAAVHVLEEVVAGSSLPTVRYKAMVEDDKIVSWEYMDK